MNSLPNVPRSARGQEESQPTAATTANDGKVEVQFEDGTVVRLAPNGLLTLASLNGQQGAELVLTQGLGYFEVPAGAQGQLNIRFGTSLLTAGAGTVLRIRMDTPPGELAVFAGQVHLSRAGGLELDLHAASELFEIDLPPIDAQGLPNLPGCFCAHPTIVGHDVCSFRSALRNAH